MIRPIVAWALLVDHRAAAFRCQQPVEVSVVPVTGAVLSYQLPVLAQARQRSEEVFRARLETACPHL